ncbi:MAG: hypothetical protein LBL61_06235 [Elusimicrobiota bacterium]|nr:hypothetical protein [Elusimicrobiota bacterium]
MDFEPKTSYNGRWMLIVDKGKLKPFKYREIVQNNALLLPYNTARKANNKE